MMVLGRFWIFKALLALNCFTESISNFQNRCLRSTALQIQWCALATVLFSSYDSFWRLGLLENWIQSYVWDIALAVLSGLERRSTHPESWHHLSFRGHWPCRCTSQAQQSWSPRPYFWPSSTYPRRRIPEFWSMIIQQVCSCLCAGVLECKLYVETLCYIACCFLRLISCMEFHRICSTLYKMLDTSFVDMIIMLYLLVWYMIYQLTDNIQWSGSGKYMPYDMLSYCTTTTTTTATTLLLIRLLLPIRLLPLLLLLLPYVKTAHLYEKWHDQTYYMLNAICYVIWSIMFNNKCWVKFNKFPQEQWVTEK